MQTPKTAPNDLEFRDKILHCRICGAEFVFSVGEQQYYHDRALVEPKRCPKCRWNRKGAAK